jgi:hypothetical protein
VTDVLILSGPAGVGKSSTAYEMVRLLEEAGIDHALVDTDELDRIYPRPADPDGVSEKNLAAVWQTFREAGARRLILVGVYLDQPSQLAWIARAVPSAKFTLVRLMASESTLADRIARREIGSGRELQLSRTRRQLAVLRADHQADVQLLHVDGTSVLALAKQVVALWNPTL